MRSVLWELKSDKALAAIKDGKRVDGRKFDEYRKLEISNGISEWAEGSAKVKLGKTEVACGIKMLPGDPYPDSPDEGTISCGAELLPLANPEFESGPPSVYATELSRVVDRGVRESGTIDFKKLCIKEGEKVWIVFIDMYAVNDDGNLFDAFSIGALSSLLQAKVPKLDENYKVQKREYSGDLKVERKPLLSTFAKVGNQVILDPTIAEEKAMTARFSLATTEDDLITAYQKGGPGSFSRKEIDYCIETAFKKAKELRKKV
jgi:exosome complex component RRP42